MPHKSSVLQHLDELDPAAEAIGAVNTIVNERGVLKGYNSDWIGIRDPLTARFDLEGRSVAILGAGGAARAACYALQQIGALPVVYNRTLETAAKLARAFGARAFELKSDSVFEGCCVVINATSAGMYPEASVSPVSAEQLNGVELVFDLVLSLIHI